MRVLPIVWLCPSIDTPCPSAYGLVLKTGHWWCVHMSNTDDLIAPIYGEGLKTGAEPDGTRLDCPFFDDRLELCRAWLAGFSTGRMTRNAGG